MSIYHNPDKLLLKRFNEKNGLALKSEQVVFTNPRDAKLVDPVMAKNYNSVIDVVMQKNAPYDGVAVLFYNRINFAYEFANSRLLDLNYLVVEEEKTIHELIPALNRKLGLALVPEEVADKAFESIGLFTTVQVQVLPGSKRYIGSFNINLMRRGGSFVPITLRNSVVDVLDADRKAAAAKPDYPIYSLNYHIDYSSAAGVLRKLGALLTYPNWGGEDIAELLQDNSTALTGALNGADGLGWVYTAAATAANNLARCVVIYNGPTKDCLVYPEGYKKNKPIEVVGANPSNTDFDNVLVLVNNNPYYSTNRYKPLVLFHYND